MVHRVGVESAAQRRLGVYVHRCAWSGWKLTQRGVAHRQRPGTIEMRDGRSCADAQPLVEATSFKAEGR